MAERGLDQWDTALAHLCEVVEIYINLNDRGMIGRSFIELTDAFIWAGRFHEAVPTARRGLAYLGTDVSADRVRLLAALGDACAPTVGYEPAHEALREAFNIAWQLSDPELEARLHGVRLTVNFHFLRLREAAAAGLRIGKSSGSEASPWRRGPTVTNSASGFTLPWTPGRGGEYCGGARTPGGKDRAIFGDRSLRQRSNLG